MSVLWDRGVGPQVNKCDDHQMSVVGKLLVPVVGTYLEDGKGRHRKVQCIMENGHLATDPPPQWTEICLWKHYNLTTSFVGGKSVNIIFSWTTTVNIQSENPELLIRCFNVELITLFFPI